MRLDEEISRLFSLRSYSGKTYLISKKYSGEAVASGNICVSDSKGKMNRMSKMI
jgi:hypothetical protein